MANDHRRAERMLTVPQTTPSPQLTCIECGEPLALKLSERQICDRCFAAFRAEMAAYAVHQELDRDLKREREAWAKECGIPQPGRVTSLILNGSSFGEDWKDYTVETLGMREDARRIRHRNINVYADWRLSPDGEPLIAIRGLEDESVNQKHVTLLYGALKLIRTKKGGGRKPGSGLYPTMQEFHAAYFKVIESFRRKNSKPTAPMIAGDLCLSDSRYYDLLKQWPPTGSNS
jgi:hypothetical protein